MKYNNNTSAAYLFFTPALLAIFIFFLIPVLAALIMSFTDFDIYSLGHINYARFDRI